MNPAGRDAPRPPRGERSTDLGKRLTDARLRAGLTQRQLAGRFGVGVSTLRTWERGTAEPRGIALRVIDAFLRRHPAP